MSFKCFLIDDSPAIWGKPALEAAPCYGLLPGDRVTEIGKTGKNGNETSDNRVLKLVTPLTYSGLISANQVKPGLYKNDDIYAAFQVSENLCKRNLFSPEGSLYVLMLVMEHGYLWREMIKDRGIFTYQAIFKKISINN